MKRASVLPEGMRFAGDIEGDGDLVVAGSIEGAVQLQGRLVIEVSGLLRGDVHATAVFVHGVLLGDAVATDSVRVEECGRLVGDVRAPRVQMVEGALLRGRVTMAGNAVPSVVPPPRPRVHARRSEAEYSAPQVSPHLRADASPLAALRALEAREVHLRARALPVGRLDADPGAELAGRCTEHRAPPAPARVTSETWKSLDGTAVRRPVLPPPPVIAPVGRRSARRREIGGRA